MATVGIRELKNRLSEFLRRAAEGERVTVTDRGRPLAVIVPAAETAQDEKLVLMVREGLAKWDGGKPPPPRRRVRLRGKPISETVIEDRR
jgi:prevent-host-death family protein